MLIDAAFRDPHDTAKRACDTVAVLDKIGENANPLAGAWTLPCRLFLCTLQPGHQVLAAWVPLDNEINTFS